MDELIESLDPESNDFKSPKSLPNATVVLVLGIVSIAGCVFWGVPGIVCGIIAIVLYKKDKSIYESDPQAYELSFKNSKAGYICGVIGLCLSILFLIFMIIYVFFMMDLITNLKYH